MRTSAVVDDRTSLRVLLSFKEPHAQTNPYITQLRDCLANTDGVEPVSFTWGIALSGDYDVFHAHWPESLIEQRGAITTFGRRVLYAMFLVRLKLGGIPVVRTVHNVGLPQGISRFDRWLLATTDRLTSVQIILNPFTPVRAGSESVLIEHGHYRDWFAKYPRSERVRGRFVFFGKVRRYKNVEGLLHAFRGVAFSPESGTLHVVGSPSTPELAESLRTIADGDTRIELRLDYVDDAQLVREASEGSVIVLPYPEMHNSGSVLAALSLDRPVLVPNNDFNRALDAEVGPGWVIRYEGELTPMDLKTAAARAEAKLTEDRPNLSRREWSETGRSHLEAYRHALNASSHLRR